MISQSVARFEKYVLTPLSFVLPAAAILYAIQHAWLIVLYFGLAWWWIGLVGATIHRDDGTRGDELVRAARSTSYFFGTTLAILLLHYRVRWFISIPVGYILSLFLFYAFLLFAVPSDDHKTPNQI